jgi:hypothetical protein
VDFVVAADLDQFSEKRFSRRFPAQFSISRRRLQSV